LDIDVRAIAGAIGYPAAGLGILIESAGIPFPGETMTIAAAAYAATGALDIRLVAPIAALGSLIGANLGYAAGYRGGRPFLERFSRLLRLNASRMARTEAFFARYGAATVLLGRFVLGLRTWSALMAGMARMPFWLPVRERGRRADLGRRGQLDRLLPGKELGPDHAAHRLPGGGRGGGRDPHHVGTLAAPKTRPA
jgi:membrane protein YqaA with SNARE-associated domain